MSEEAMILPPHGSSVVGGRWRLTKKIGSGSFGDVFVGENIKEDAHQPDVAVKLESSRRKNPHLIYEAKLMQNLEGGVGVPVVYHYGQENGYNVMVLDLLGPSLEELFDDCGRRFSLKTTLQLIEMMLSRIEFVHSRFIIHRDIKPHNFLMGRGTLDRLVHIIDFGLAKKYRDSKTLDHIPYKEGKTLTGTARYVSVSTHIGVEQSRRDDMESLGYVFIYFVKGSLPWQSLKSNNKKNKYEKIKDMKISNDPVNLCAGLPKEFADYLNYTRLLRFTERPDYTFCRSLFRDLFFREQFANDFLFDWSPVARVNSLAVAGGGGGAGHKDQRVAGGAANAGNVAVRVPATRRNIVAQTAFNDYLLPPPPPQATRHAALAGKIRKEEAIYTNDGYDDD